MPAVCPLPPARSPPAPDGSTPPPHAPGSAPATVGFSICADNPTREGAWEAIKLMPGPQYRRALAQVTGPIPVPYLYVVALRRLVWGIVGGVEG